MKLVIDHITAYTIERTDRMVLQHWVVNTWSPFQFKDLLQLSNHGHYILSVQTNTLTHYD